MTVTGQKAVTLLSALHFAVMKASPSATPVTLPVLSTVAMSVSLLDHVTVWSASSGVTVAAIVPVSSTFTESEVGSSIRLVGAGLTVICSS